MSTGNALIDYRQFAAGKNILAGQPFGGWPANLQGKWEEQPYNHHHIRVHAVSTNTVTSGLSWQYASATVGNVIPAEAGDVYQLKTHQPDSQTRVENLGEVRWNESAAFSLGDDQLSVQINWECRPSAFAQVDDDRERRAVSEADNALIALPGEVGARVHARLHKLIEIAGEEGLETAGPSPDSVRASIGFMAAIVASGVRFRVPSIALDSTGLVVLEWRGSSGASAVLRFLADGSVGCALTTHARGRLSPNTWFGIVTAEETRRTVLDSDALSRLIGG